MKIDVNLPLESRIIPMMKHMKQRLKRAIVTRLTVTNVLYFVAIFIANKRSMLMNIKVTPEKPPSAMTIVCDKIPDIQYMRYVPFICMVWKNMKFSGCAMAPVHTSDIARPKISIIDGLRRDGVFQIARTIIEFNTVVNSPETK
jgi:hypothetical protein